MITRGSEKQARMGFIIITNRALILNRTEVESSMRNLFLVRVFGGSLCRRYQAMELDRLLLNVNDLQLEFCGRVKYFMFTRHPILESLSVNSLEFPALQ